MTLVIAAPGKDYVILGADSRGVIQTEAARIELNIMSKLFPITKYAAILMYGASDEGNQLVEKYRKKMNKKKEGVTAVAEDFTRFCRKEEKELAGVPRHPEAWRLFGFVICGLDKEGEAFKTPLLYHTDNLGGFRLGLCKPFAIRGKPLIAYYLFAKEFREDMPLNELCKLVAQAIYDTKSIDGDVGGTIKLGVIDAEGFREISDSDISDLIEEWQLKGLKKAME
jgi:20S proteasome alpha/beta subunit